MGKGILFDLDGTLWDSGEGVAASWNLALERLGRPERTDAAFVHSIMGMTLGQISERLFSGMDRAEADRTMDYCLRAENEYLRIHGGVLFDGLEETLRTLREAGLFLGIVSNCQEGYIEAFLERHGLGGFILDTECYGHTGEGKGANIRRVVLRNGLEAAAYLGDTMGDYEAAREAEVPFIHASYGFGTVPAEVPAIRSLRELPDLLCRLGF